MTIRLVTDEKIAETSSKGNQEKWYDQTTDCWYKLDQFGFEALAETVASILLERSNIETDTPFTFARYHMERLRVHGRERTGCSSKNFCGQANRSSRSIVYYLPESVKLHSKIRHVRQFYAADTRLRMRTASPVKMGVKEPPSEPESNRMVYSC